MNRIRFEWGLGWSLNFRMNRIRFERGLGWSLNFRMVGLAGRGIGLGFRRLGGEIGGKQK